MKLKNAAKAFDRTTAVDAYDAFSSFRCQVEPLDMYRTEGTRIKVRNMSTSPDVDIPTRRAIMFDGQAYLVSDVSYDYWGKEKIRARYVIQGADHVVEIRTIPQILGSVAGIQAYASIEFNKYSTDERDNSDYHPQYHIFFGKEEVREGVIVSTSTRSFLVRNSYTTPAGIVDALCNELDSPVIDAAVFKVRTYNPTTDSFTETSSTVRCIRVRWQDHFTYLSQGSQKYERGDMVVFMPLSVTPKPSDVIELGDGAWRVLASVDFSGYRSLHMRRV